MQIGLTEIIHFLVIDRADQAGETNAFDVDPVKHKIQIVVEIVPLLDALRKFARRKEHVEISIMTIHVAHRRADA